MSASWRMGGLCFVTVPEALALGCAGCGTDTEIALIDSGSGNAPLCIECFVMAVAEEAHRDGFELGQRAELLVRTTEPDVLERATMLLEAAKAEEASR